MSQARHYEMKDSGVEWIGEMPRGWKKGRIKYNYYLKGRIGWQGLKAEEFIDDGPYYLITGTDFENGHIAWERCYHINETRFQEAPEIHVKIDDLLITKDGTVGKVSYIDYIPEKASLNSHLLIIRPLVEDYSNKYLFWVIQSSVFEKYCGLSQNGSIMASLSQEKMSGFSFPLPSLAEQLAIAAYLGERCATIDAIVAEAKATIDEYEAWKASVIFEAVTKGLDPNAEMKDSGVEWIGSIPKAWQYVPLKYLASCNDEVLTEATPEDYTFDYIDIGSVHTGNGIGMCERMQFKDAPSRARRIVRDGDIIVSTVRTYLKAIAQVGNYDVPHIASTGFAVIRTKNANAFFLKYALLSDNFVSQVEADSVGISYPAINATQIMAFKIPVPSIAEQTDIALYLDDKCAAIDGVIAEKEALIGELESYKKSLIFETVTGKRRVC